MEEAKRKKTRIKMLNITKILVIVGFVLVFVSGVKLASAASLYFSPSSGSYHQGENFTVSALLNTDQPANAVRGIVTYSTKYISVISVNYISSIVDLWVRKPSFSNFGDSGNVTFEGVILNPGFTGSGGRIINIVFGVREQGSANVEITDFAILANDGLGTNIAVAGNEANFSFTSPLPPGQSKSTTDEKINTIEDKVRKIEEQTRLINFLQEVNFYNRINNLWEILPLWIKFITIILIGVIAMLLLLILGLIIMVIIWIWNHIKYRRLYIKFQLKRSIDAIKIFSRKLWVFIGMAEKEIESDIAYSRLKFEESYHEATQQIPIRIMLRGYFSRVWGVIKRLFTINYKKGQEDEINENKEDEIPENKENALPKDKDIDL